MDVNELAPNTGYARNLSDPPGAAEVFEPGIAIGNAASRGSGRDDPSGCWPLRSPENRYHAAGSALPTQGCSSRA